MNYQITCVCGNRFFITEQQLAGHVTCTSCGRPLIPVVSPQQPASPRPTVPDPPSPTAQTTDDAAGVPGDPAIAASAEPTKRCPFCGEVILAIARKCKHCGEFLDRAPAPSNPLTFHADQGVAGEGQANPGINQPGPANPNEVPVFTLSVSQWDNFWKFLICIVLDIVVAFLLIKIPALQQYAVIGILSTTVLLAFMCWFFYMATRSSRCIIRPIRIETEVGVLSKDITAVDLFRVTDLVLLQGIVARILGIGTIRVRSNDPNTPELIIYQIPHARAVYKYLQQQVPIAARQRGAVYLER